MLEKRDFDPGLDTPRANEPGAGFPVPGSSVWLDAEHRKRVHEEELRALRAQAEAANNSQRVDEGGKPTINPEIPVGEDKIDTKLAEINTEATNKTTEKKPTTLTARTEKDAAAKREQSTKGNK